MEPGTDDGRSGGDGCEDEAVVAVDGEETAAVAAVAESRFDSDVTHFELERDRESVCKIYRE